MQAANTQPSNIPSESRNPRSKRTTFHITGTTFHEHKHFLKFTNSIFIQPGRETNTSHQRKALDSNQEASVEPLCSLPDLHTTRLSNREHTEIKNTPSTDTSTQQNQFFLYKLKQINRGQYLCINMSTKQSVDVQ